MLRKPQTFVDKEGSPSLLINEPFLLEPSEDMRCPLPDDLHQDMRPHFLSTPFEPPCFLNGPFFFVLQVQSSSLFNRIALAYKLTTCIQT